MLRDRLGAELVETRTPDYADDPAVADLTFTFADALSEMLPRLVPEVFSRRNAKGELYFAVPGYDVTTYDYLLKLSRHKAPLTAAVDITNFANFAALPCHNALCADVEFDVDRYLAARGDRASRRGATGSRTPSSARTSRAPARRTGSPGTTTKSSARPIGSRAATSRAWRCCA